MLKKLGGVRTPHRKSTAEMSDVIMPPPPEVVIPMLMHRGEPASCVVSVGDAVKMGQLIGEGDGTKSTNIHASCSGTVSKIEVTARATGKPVTCVTIKTDGLQTFHESVVPHPVADLDELLAAIRASGVVGLGGAAAPTGPKLTLKNPEGYDTLIINGAECEPYMTCDTRTMIDDADLMWDGIRTIARLMSFKRIVIAIENNKPEPIRIFKAFCEKEPIAEVFVLPALYPQGGKTSLIYHIAGRAIPEGGRPGDVGCVVMNCSTLAYVMRYIVQGYPMFCKRVTVDGGAVKNPQNVVVPLGASVADVFEFCGGLSDDVKKIISGGPMMGVAVPDMNMSVVKSTNTLLAFTEREAKIPPESDCIRCGRCVSGCPMRLNPAEISDAFLSGKTPRLAEFKANICIECGCCSYICPAKRQLTRNMKLAKSSLSEYKRRLTEK